jgi:arginyl-tRNA synthetase
MINYKLEIAIKLNKITGVSADDIIKYIEIPPNSDLGDFAFPCFKLAKDLKKSPIAIATEIKEKLQEDEVIERVVVVNGYLNIFIKKLDFIKSVLNEVVTKGDLYGSSNMGEGKSVVIDYSAPNIAKPFHIGHLRSTVIGGSLYKIYKFLGYKVIGINHLGDWGMGIARTIAGYEMWKEEYDFSTNPLDSILKIYVRFNKLEKEDPSILDFARAALRRLEDKDVVTTDLWKWIISISLKEYNRIYELIGCKFDSYNGEAFYNDKMDRVIKELENKKLLVESEGAKVVMLDEYNMPPCIIITSAGTTIYATRDLAALLYRIENYDFNKALYLVGNEQALHFRQIFKTLELMGYEKYAKSCEHIPFGLILDETGEKIGSRKGNSITLDEIFSEAIQKSLKIIEEKNPELENKEEVAKKVGVGAIIFNDLANNRIKDEIFDWNLVLNFSGETGPYMQYTYVRTQSILRNVTSVLSDNIDYDKLLDKEAIEVIKSLNNFSEIVVNAADKNEPSLISRYLIDVAQSYSRFYNEHQILCEESKTRDARLLLTKCVGNTIKNGLSLLGIECPERM